MRKMNEDNDNAAQTMTRMITEASRSTASAWAPYVMLSALSAALMLGGETLSSALRYDRLAVDSGEWWRLITANLVHLGWWHWLFNVLSLALLVLLCPERPSIGEWLLRILLIGMGMCLGLHLFTPKLQNYVGLSGLAYGLLAFGFVRQIVAGDRFAIACLGFITARIVWEMVIGAPKSEEALIGGSVVAESHLYGVVAAVLYGLMTGAFRRPARPATA